MLLAHCTVVDRGSLCLLFLLWVEPGDEYVIEEPVEYAYEDQANVNSENFAGKMTMLALSLCLCYDTYHLLIMPPILPCQPLTILS